MFEVECIDRMYLNVYVPQLQRVGRLVALSTGTWAMPIASTAVMAPVSEAFIGAMRTFAAGCTACRWSTSPRDNARTTWLHEYLAAFTGTEGVLFIGRAQEKMTVFRTRKRRSADGRSYPWIVAETGGGQPVLRLLRR